MTQDELFPAEIERDVYRRLHPDLAQLEDQALFEHFRRFGRSEGRVGNRLADRESFARLITPQMKALEIGPFTRPLLEGDNVVYCDVMSRELLKARAVEIGLDASRVPEISYVLGTEGLDTIPADFDAVLSSHSIEHQPDLVRHLQQVERRLEVKKGRYFLLIPDKRYTFDRYIAESTIADILDAHVGKRTVHSLRSVIEHRALTTHNDPRLHWSEHDKCLPIEPSRVSNALEEWRAAGGGYIDVHAWYFTPMSFEANVRLMAQLGLTRFQIEHVYATRRGAGEFWAILSL